ncbi:MAG: amidohydrolase family protein [Pseudomonadales bacterium]
MLLRNLKIWDGIENHYSDQFDALRITDQGLLVLTTSDDIQGGEATQDLAGAYAIPGLIDAHIHLCLDPREPDPFAHGKLPESEQLKAMAERAYKMVRAGITSARDLGGGQWLELKIRDAIKSGDIQGPRLVCAGQPITSVEGHCHFWGGEANDEASALTVLDRQVKKGVDLIKVMATGGNITPGSRPVDAQFDETIIRAIVRAANSQGFSVAAHCHGVDGIRNAAHAGVTTIEHCSWVGPEGWGKHYEPELARTIGEKGIWVSPTVNAGWGRHLGNERYLAAINARYQAMRAEGCRLIASTDAGIPNVFHEDLPKALAVFKAVAALSNLETLKSATSECARAVGLEAVTGRLADGLSADILMFDQSPLDNLEVLENPSWIFANGQQITGQ